MLKLVAHTVVVSRKVVLLSRAFAARVVCTYTLGAFCTHCSGWLADWLICTIALSPRVKLLVLQVSHIHVWIFFLWWNREWDLHKFNAMLSPYIPYIFRYCSLLILKIMSSSKVFFFIILWESQYGQHSTTGGVHKRKENWIKPRDGTGKQAMGLKHTRLFSTRPQWWICRPGGSLHLVHGVGWCSTSLLLMRRL